jgi:nucleoid DNA-binding protein
MAVKKKGAGKTAGTTTQKGPTQAQIFELIAQNTELPKKDVRRMFTALQELTQKNLTGRGPGQFTVPGICKLVVRTKPARPARKGTNPFTGEPMTFKAKPKSKTVRARPVKAIKDCVA